MVDYIYKISVHGKTTSDLPVVQNDMTILLVSRECHANQFYNKTQPLTEVKVEMW